MKVIGLTPELQAAVTTQLRSPFEEWLKELRKGDWRDRESLMHHYPRSCPVVAAEHHFPLLADGTGVRATLFFRLGSIRLLGLAPLPTMAKNRRSADFPAPRHERKPQATSP